MIEGGADVNVWNLDGENVVSALIDNPKKILCPKLLCILLDAGFKFVNLSSLDFIAIKKHLKIAFVQQKVVCVICLQTKLKQYILSDVLMYF